MNEWERLNSVDDSFVVRTLTRVDSKDGLRFRCPGNRWRGGEGRGKKS